MTTVSSGVGPLKIQNLTSLLNSGTSVAISGICQAVRIFLGADSYTLYWVDPKTGIYQGRRPPGRQRQTNAEDDFMRELWLAEEPGRSGRPILDLPVLDGLPRCNMDFPGADAEWTKRCGHIALSEDPQDQGLLSIPIVRAKQTLGLCLLRWPVSVAPTKDMVAEATGALELLLQVMDRSFVINALKLTCTPLDLSSDEHEYFDFLAGRLAEALGATYCAVRYTETPGSTRTYIRGYAGAGRQDLTDAEFDGSRRHFAVGRAIRSNRLVHVSNLSDPDGQMIRDRLEIPDLNSYLVAPIRDAGNQTVIGVFTAAAKAALPLSQLQRSACEALASWAGEVSNRYDLFRRSQLALAKLTGDVMESMQGELVELFQHAAQDSVLPLSLASQSAREELVQLFSTMHLSPRANTTPSTSWSDRIVDTARVSKAYDSATAKQVAEHVESLDYYLDSVDEVSKYLKDRIDMAKMVRSEDAGSSGVNVVTIWQNTVPLMGSSFSHTHSIRGDFRFPGSERKLSAVFFLLMQNSIEAHKARGGSVKLSVSLRGNADDGVLLYTDNAGGLDVTGAIREATEALHIDRREVIFRPGVTSKGGTGKGLWLARSLLESVGGSLRLANEGRSKTGIGATGCVFRASLPIEGQRFNT